MSVPIYQPKPDKTVDYLMQAGSMIPGIGPAFSAANLGRQMMADNQAPQGQSAMDRRAGPQAPQVDDPVKALEDARVALASQPPEMQQQYGAPIMSALLQARRQQGVA